MSSGEALGIGASELVLRSPLGSPNAHVHFSTGSAARRYLLRLEARTHSDHPPADRVDSADLQECGAIWFSFVSKLALETLKNPLTLF